MGMFILTVIIITVIIWLSVRKKKVRTPNVAFRQLGDRDENDAVSPSMYNQSINAMAKDYIKDELKEQGFSLFDSTLDLEVKKSVLTIIFAVVLMLNNFMILFRISSLLSIFIFLLSVILFIVFFTKFNLYGILIKRFNERQDENMEYIIASYIQQRTNRVVFIIGRLLIFLFLFSFRDQKIDKKEGLLLLLLFVIYYSYVILNG